MKTELHNYLTNPKPSIDELKLNSSLYESNGSSWVGYGTNTKVSIISKNSNSNLSAIVPASFFCSTPSFVPLKSNQEIYQSQGIIGGSIGGISGNPSDSDAIFTKILKQMIILVLHFKLN